MDDKILKFIAFILAIIVVILVYAISLRENDQAVASELASSTPLPSSTETVQEIEVVKYIYYDVPFDVDTQREITDVCSEYNLTYELILGVISVECASFEPNTLGDGGNSFGLMQIQPKWWSETMAQEGVTNLLDPIQNVRCGCAILRDLCKKYGTVYRALQYYNTGDADSNNGYADKVYQAMDDLRLLSEGV